MANKTILLGFKQTLGLNINLQKSLLIYMNPSTKEASRQAKPMNCNIGSFPFTYLGLPFCDRKLPKSC